MVLRSANRRFLMGQSVAESGSDLFLLRRIDAGKERKGEGAGADGIGDGDVRLGLQDEGAAGGLLMNGGEVSGSGDAARGQDCPDGRAVGVHG